MDKKNRKEKNKKFDEKKNFKKKSEIAQEELKEIRQKILDELPPTGKYSICTEETKEMNLDKMELWEKPYQKFKDLPISNKTIQGLNENKYFQMTPIQRATLPHSFGGRDIMGASKTGSGKTLCFLIPILENLYRDGFLKEEGLGALILLPTRELAIQIFEVINKIGKHHSFSVGMVIGGNNLEKEKSAVGYMNILIGTPGRVLQHMSETPYFSADNLKMLVIDEADRILDEGFEEELTQILNYLPKNRQTLLFSATLTKGLKRIIKIHMRSPEYINLSNTDIIMNTIENINKNELSIMRVKDNNNITNINTINESNSNDLIIPKNLNQFYTIVEPEDRINVLYSFFKTHKTSKCLVFVSSRKQVRYFTEVFKHLKLGMLFLDIHGKQKQDKRSNTFFTFSQKRNSVVLFATDLASRGVDFPAIDWVIQLDPPEDIAQYIHRVGRTARYKSDGNSILFVSVKEQLFVEDLKTRKIDIKRMKIPSNKIFNIIPIVRSVLSEHSELIEAAEKAITSYVKAINLFPNKKIYDVKNIDLNKLTLSYGLVSSPEMVVIKKEEVEQKIEENENEKIKENKKINDEENKIAKDANILNEDNIINKKKSKLQKLKEKIKMKKLLKKEENKENDLDNFLIEKTNNENNETGNQNDNKKLLNKKTKNERVENEENSNSEKDGDEENEYYNKIKKKLEINKEKDKQKEKQRILNKHKEDKIKQKEKDYIKHGINLDENNIEENVENIKENENIENADNNENIEENKNKIKININHSTLKEKENAALEILKQKGLI